MTGPTRPRRPVGPVFIVCCWFAGVAVLLVNSPLRAVFGG